VTQKKERLHYCRGGNAGRDPKTDYCALGFTKLATFFPMALPALGRLPENFDKKLSHLISTSRFPKPVRTGTSGYFAHRSQLIAIYKSVCRHFYRRYFRAHRRAILVVSRICSQSTQSLDGELAWRRPFAPAAMAFVLWRMYWESLISPRELFRPRKSIRRLPFYTERIHWKQLVADRLREQFGGCISGISRAIAEEIQLRWFAEACLRTLDESLVLFVNSFKRFKQPDHRNRISTNWITGALVPFMLADISKDGCVILNWLLPYGKPILERESYLSLIQDPPSKSETNDFLKDLDLVGRLLVEGVSRRLRGQSEEPKNHD
jgi:hypothetical protein